MATWYEAEAKYRFKINAVEVERATEHSVFIRGRRNAKSSSYSSYFPTWAEAFNFLMDGAQKKLIAARRNLQDAQSIHGNVIGMKPPVDKEST